MALIAAKSSIGKGKIKALQTIGEKKLCSAEKKLNPDYAIAFVMSGVITKKSGFLKTEA